MTDAPTTTAGSSRRRAPRGAAAALGGGGHEGLRFAARLLTRAAALRAYGAQQVSLEGVINGEPTPVAWMSSLGTLYKCNKARALAPRPWARTIAPLTRRCRAAPQMLGTGSHALSSVLSMAKKYPRVLLLQQDRLLCCKLDELELCTYKWIK